jgi:cell division protein FtsL
MRMIVYLSVIIASMVVFVSGILFNEIWFIVLGGVVSIIVFLYFYLKLRKERERFDIPEDKYETVLSMRSKKSFKVRKSLIGYILVIVLGIAILIIIYISMKTYLYTPSSLSIENMINEGCRKLNTGNGLCESDPNNITVNYDVNKDGIIGGVNDTLSNILVPNCDAMCVKRRCGCMV